MNENDFALKIAEIAFEIKQYNLWSDLIKVGVPSSVAIISAFFTYRVTVKNNKVNLEVAQLSKTIDEKIAKLKLEHEKEKDVSGKKTKLIEELAERLSLMYSSFTQYNRTIKGKLYAREVGNILPGAYADELRDQFLSASKTLEENYNKAETIALLLGHEIIVNKVRNFYKEMAQISSAFNLECKPDLKTFDKYQVSFINTADDLFSTLSKLYISQE